MSPAEHSFIESLHNVAPDEVAEHIPAGLLEVPGRVYEACGIETRVLEFNDEIRAYSPSLTSGEGILDINPDDSAITIWVSPGVTARMLSHELIHLRRNVLESVPRLFPLVTKSKSDNDEILKLENELEHLFIIPEEIRAFPAAEAWWTRHYEQLLDSAESNPDNLALCLHWSQIRNSLPDQIELAKRLASILRSRGGRLAEVADYLRQDMKDALPNKTAMQTAMVELLKITSSRFCIGRYVTVDGLLHVEALLEDEPH